MASEELFPNDHTEELDLEQELNEIADKSTEETPHEQGEKENSPAAAEDKSVATKTPAEPAEHEAKLCQLPIARIRNIMKLDPDLHVASNEAVFAVAKAVELFIESLARESYTYTAQAKKKTIQKRDVDLAISAVDSLMFLDGAMNF
ncbi:uncharacterized protein Dwil_GK20815 [Drosophila willistoni]|uniref:Transcription factor CBF/NF-Y/archaeal histone domain-containing protein n=1 Tax=Drosophila willistoni TaxID=7260 RepID=B4MJG1_DROWI|nr:DNA polymerase epsilon subunit 4 [Drosophila willistoni]EDW72250.2 uncharacterized protein Dwil_GK20815 [Drosophila willistoni]